MELTFLGIFDLSTDINQLTLAFSKYSVPFALVELLNLTFEFNGLPKLRMRKSNK